MKKFTKYLKMAVFLLLFGVVVYFAVQFVEVWQAYRQNEIDCSKAISEFLIYESSSEPADTTTVPPTDVLSSSSAETSVETTTETSSETSAETTTTTTPLPTTTTEKSIWPTFTLNWTAMNRTNPEIVGWIWAYDTTISFPLLQSDDNVKYLTTTYNGSYGSLGSIFLDYRVNSDFTSRNTIIYGHNGNHGVMFGALEYYLKASYVESHPYFCIMTRDGLKKYEIFSVYLVDAYSDSYSVYFQTDTHFTNYLSKIVSRSFFDTGVTVSTSDLVVTLSTCTNNVNDENERIVVHGKLITE